jgi:hypothetical protein
MNIKKCIRLLRLLRAILSAIEKKVTIIGVWKPVPTFTDSYPLSLFVINITWQK